MSYLFVCCLLDFFIRNKILHPMLRTSIILESNPNRFYHDPALNFLKFSTFCIYPPRIHIVFLENPSGIPTNFTLLLWNFPLISSTKWLRIFLWKSSIQLKFSFFLSGSIDKVRSGHLISQLILNNFHFLAILENVLTMYCLLKQDNI